MQDDLERQLDAFGRTLRAETPEPIANDGDGVLATSRPIARRMWAMVGAAACLVAAIVGLVVVNGRDRSTGPADVPADVPALPTATTTTTTKRAAATVAPTIPDLPESAVGNDPLGLERDGWLLVDRTTEPFTLAGDDIPCPSSSLGARFDGVPQVHDVLTPPEASGLDLDIYVLDVGEAPRGDALADLVQELGRCLSELEGVTVETGGLSAISASWFRAGPDFALVAIVGEGRRSVVLEIEGAVFDDELIAELARRTASFLSGEAFG